MNEPLTEGQVARSATRTVTEDDLGVLHSLSWATSELHSNRVAMVDSAFGERLFSGPMLAAVMDQLRRDSPPFRELVADFGAQPRGLRMDARYRSTVTVGDQITVTSTVTALERQPNRLHVIVDECAYNHHDAVVAEITREEIYGAEPDEQFPGLTAKDVPEHDLPEALAALVPPDEPTAVSAGRTLTHAEVELLVGRVQGESRPAHAGATVSNVPASLVFPIVASLAARSPLDRTLQQHGIETIAALRHLAAFVRPVSTHDTLWAESELVSCRPSSSRPGCGVMTLRERGIDATGQPVIDMLRVLLVAVPSFRQE